MADACGVTRQALDRWIFGSAEPPREAREILQREFLVQERWWSELATTTADDPAKLVLAWQLGIALPDQEQRAAIENALGIPAAAWDQPAS